MTSPFRLRSITSDTADAIPGYKAQLGAVLDENVASRLRGIDADSVICDHCARAPEP